MDTSKVKSGWLEIIKIEESKPYFKKIQKKIDSSDEYIFPVKKNIFRVFNYFEPNETKLVLLGQDPYIGFEMVENEMLPQAMGLSFSVPNKIKKIPPSLVNIFKEIKNSYPNFIIPKNGNLIRWVKKEKILLLNASLTVIKGKSGSHMKYWEPFTNAIIKTLSDNYENIVFLLFGNFAKQKQCLINKKKHHIITAVHPSPLSAYRGFFGCNAFKIANEKIKLAGKKEIIWDLS